MTEVGYVSSPELMDKARSAARRALELDSQLPESHAALANLDLSYFWNFPEAEEESQKALALDPNSAYAHEVSCWVLVSKGQRESTLVGRSMPFGFGLSGPHHRENFGEADADPHAKDRRLRCQSLYAGLSRKTHPHNAKLRPRRTELHVQHFSGLDLRAHADQNCPMIADVLHANNLRERPRHPVHSPDAYR